MSPNSKKARGNKMKYIDTFKEHGSYISDKWSHYLYIYDTVLQNLIKQNQPVKLLEIGVQNGGSLEIWKKYLPVGSEIYGIDINEKCKDITFDENIHFILGDGTDKRFINENLKDIKFDVIIDDGSHINRDIIESFNIFFLNKLKMGGLYIIEDMHTSYFKVYGGGFRKNNTCIEFFKKLVDSLNFPYFEKIGFLYKKEVSALAELNKQVKCISFYDSICVIEKFAREKTCDNFPVTTGQTALVNNSLSSPHHSKCTEKLKNIGEIYKGL